MFKQTISGAWENVLLWTTSKSITYQLFALYTYEAGANSMFHVSGNKIWIHHSTIYEETRYFGCVALRLNI